jgi:hypothetical protein
MSNPGALKSAELRRAKAKENFITKSIEVHGGSYDYSKAKYVGACDPVTIVCKEHGEFLQTPTVHKRGCGCPKCGPAKQGMNGRNTSTVWINRFTSRYGSIYDYSKAVFTLAHSKIEIVCSEHGSFFKSPQKHLEQGCPSCSVYGFNTMLPATLYYLSVCDGEAYKIGITNRSVKERYSSTDLAKITIVKEWEFSNGLAALAEEQRILRSFKTFMYTGKPLLENGNTELFSTDVLELCQAIDVEELEYEDE